MPILRVGEPGGHFPKDYGGFDRLGPRPRVLVTDEGHWCNLSRPMAALTVFLENWKDVLGERHGGRIGCQNGCPERQPHENHAHHELTSLARIPTTGARTLPSIHKSTPRSNQFPSTWMGGSPGRAAVLDCPPCAFPDMG